MCHHFKYLTKNKNGFLIYCYKSKAYQLSYKNLNFNLSDYELNSLVRYLKAIDCTYWEKEYENSIYEKKIPIPTLQNNFMILLEPHEVAELLSLLDFNRKSGFLSYNDINYPMNLN
ncbi:hypothetical protein GOQ30_12880 [Flavobacterium sp. TP390]|uniref:Uncharacterized protein n=1 Tax=Flavobacterium profundi TaxID=1774945 RepID=A0A6I4IT63_9FLAO|nr:DUF6686 family protein [Flavobacterium profundi]MVO10059.1 hypothetical protein [Flavobacterium profundi]